MSLPSCEMDGATHHEWMQRKTEWLAWCRSDICVIPIEAQSEFRP